MDRLRRVVVSDLGNVLLLFDRSRTYRAIAALTASTPLEVQRIIESSDIRERYEQEPDAFEDVQDFLQSLRILLHRAGAGFVDDLDALKQAWCALFWENRYVHATLRYLKMVEDIPLVLLSDTNELHYEHFRTHYRPIHDLFDVTILSFQKGVSKEKNPTAMLRLAVYESAQLVPGLAIENIIYLDDRADFVAVATEMGIDAHCYRRDPELHHWLTARGYPVPSP